MNGRNEKKRYLYTFWLILILCFIAVACSTVNGNNDAAKAFVNDVSEEKTKGPVSSENGAGHQADIISGYADLTHDGVKEKIAVDISKVDETQEAILKVLDDEGNIIWQESAWLPHAGWNSIFLCTIDGKDFLLRYNPYMIQGFGDYRYKLFSIDERGTEKVLKEGAVSFSITGEVDEFDIDKMVAFYNEINEYLDKSILLLSTEDGELAYSTENSKITRREEFSWLYDNKTEYGENDTLEDKLRKYKENMR